jgi:(2Fe-2S) ferredoxin
MYFKKHIFFCANQKENGNKCCAEADATAMLAYAKKRCKEDGLTAENNVRVSKAVCLGRCAKGPCVVIYPEGRWYTYQNQQDIDELIDSEFLDNEPVPRLAITDNEE